MHRATTEGADDFSRAWMVRVVVSEKGEVGVFFDLHALGDMRGMKTA